MRDFFRSPLFRSLICLILVCCILVNVSPIRAKAFAGLSMSAMLYLLYAAAAGAVIIPSTIAIANSVGQKLDEKIRVSFAPEFVDEWVRFNDNRWNIDDDWDPNEWKNDFEHACAGGLLALIGSMMVELVVEGAIDLVGDSAANGYAYYNNWYLPVLPSTPTYSVITVDPDTGVFTWHFSSSIEPYNDPPLTPLGTYTVYFPSGGRCAHYQYSADTGVWTQVNAGNSGYGKGYFTLCWSNFDFKNEDGTIAMAGSEPSSTQTITIEPDIYVGDLPDEIRNGEKDEENINLPIIDPFVFIKSPETAFEDVTKTLQDLKDGVITYDEYIEKVTADDPTVTPDPSDPTDPSEDPEDIPEEIAPYTFDLRKIFPFCIPFDLYDFLTCLDATPVAPVIHWEIQMPGGGSYPLNLDLSPFDSVAQLLRRLELLVFSIALAIKTRDLIKG